MNNDDQLEGVGVGKCHPSHIQYIIIYLLYFHQLFQFLLQATRI